MQNDNVIQYNTEYGFYKERINEKKTKEYAIFSSIATRCNSNNLAYLNIHIDERFKDFQFFASWCHKQKGFGLEDYQMDKDILIDGNTIYSPDVSVFVPRSINNLFVRKQKRKDYPCGVRFDKNVTSKNKFRADISIDNVKLSKRFSTADEAFDYYLTLKLEEIHRKAEAYKETIDNRVHEKMMSYTIDSLRKQCIKNKFNTDE